MKHTSEKTGRQAEDGLEGGVCKPEPDAGLASMHIRARVEHTEFPSPTVREGPGKKMDKEKKKKWTRAMNRHFSGETGQGQVRA